MKLTRPLSVLAFSASALSQIIHITSPSENQTVLLGQPLLVQIAQPLPIPALPLENVAITLGLEHCGDTPCLSDGNDQVLGQIVLRKLFDPTLDASLPFAPPTANFTVTPTGEPGFTTLHAVAMILTGPGPLAQLFSSNVSVFLASE